MLEVLFSNKKIVYYAPRKEKTWTVYKITYSLILCPELLSKFQSWLQTNSNSFQKIKMMWKKRIRTLNTFFFFLLSFWNFIYTKEILPADGNIQNNLYRHKHTFLSLKIEDTLLQDNSPIGEF